MTWEEHHEVAMGDMTWSYKSVDDLELVNTKGHKCRELARIWVGEMVCENMKSKVNAMHGKTERTITGWLGRKVKGCDNLCDS